VRTTLVPMAAILFLCTLFMVYSKELSGLIGG